MPPWKLRTTETPTRGILALQGGEDVKPQADDQLEQLEAEDRERVLKKLAEAQDWTEHRLDPLSGWSYYKLRAGDYRAIITWDRDDELLIVKAVDHRRNVYDRHLPP